MKRAFKTLFGAIVVSLSALFPALAQGNIAGVNTAELALSPQESNDVRSTTLFTKRLGRVTYSTNKVCLSCGDYWDDLNRGKDHVAKRLQVDYPAFLKKEIYETGIFPSDVKERIALNVVLKDLKQSSSVGAMAERKNPLTSGAVFNTEMSISYELVDDGQVVGAWLVTSRASSNSLSPTVRISEAIETSIKRNVRSLFLKMIADFNPVQATRAHQSLKAIGSEVDNTRSVLGYLVYGTSVTLGAVGDGLVAVAKNSGAIAAGINDAASGMAGLEAASRSSTIEQDRKRAALQADFDARVSQQKVDSVNTASSEPVSKANVAKANPAANRAAIADTTETRRKAELERVAELKKQAVEKSKQDALLREQEHAAAERIAKEKRAEEEAARKAERERLEREVAEKRSHYLQTMKSSIRLSARRCPDGEGKHYLVGIRPQVRPEVVSCINVKYTAYCPGTISGISGTVENFLGASTDCFLGDAATIPQRLSCEPKDANIVVDSVAGCFK